MGNPEQGHPAAAASSPARPRCQYGDKCFRANPEHKQEFCHPNDPDWNPAPAPTRQTQALAGYHAPGAPSAPYPDQSGGESIEDKGLMGALAGGAAVIAGGAAAHHLGAFDRPPAGSKVDPNSNEPANPAQGGGLGQMVHDHPGMALAAGAAAVLVGAFAGHKLEDAAMGKGKKGKKDKKGGKDKKDKKDKKGKKDKKSKTRDLVLGDESDSSSDSSSDDIRPGVVAH